MKAIYTTTGMQIVPYVSTKAGMILNARSVWVQGAHSRSPVTAYLVKDKDSKRLLTYHCHKAWLTQNIPGIEIEVMPKNRVESLGHQFTLNHDVMPNDVQASVVDAVITNRFKQAFFKIPTGKGKTLLSVYLMSILNMKAWAMCYRTIVLEQWKRTLEEMSTFDVSRVKIVSSSKDLLKMADGTFPFEDYDIYLSTPMLLTKFASDYGMDLLNDVMDNCGIGVKFFDEAHRNVGNICKINALTNVERTYYLSADFGQADPSRAKLYYKMFGSVPIIKPKEEVVKNMRYTVGVLVRYNSEPTFMEVEGCFQKYGWSHYKFMEYQLSKGAFYDTLEHVLDAIREADPESKYKVLILCNLIEHTDILYDWIHQYYETRMPEDTPKVVRYHSELGKEEREDALEHGQILVSTYQSMGVGVDLKMIRFVVSLSPVNPIEDNQAAGRARALPDGKDCFYFIFVDDGFAYVQKRLPARLTYLYEQKIKNIVSIKYS